MASLTPVSLFVAATSLLITPGLSVVAHAEDLTPGDAPVQREEEAV